MTRALDNYSVSMSEEAEEQYAAIVNADGSTYRFPPGTFVGDAVAGDKLIINGGLDYVMMFLAGAISSGVVGNAAYDALRLGGSKIRLRFAWGRRSDQVLFARHMAELAVRVKLDRDGTVEVTEVKEYDDHWAAVVKADGNTYRVMIPLKAPNETVVSVELA